MVTKQKLTAFTQQNLFKVFFSTGFTTGLKILSAIILSKVIAIRLGPEGLALLGQLTSFVSIALLLATGGFTNGIIKYTSQLKGTGALAPFVQQSFKISLLFASAVGILLITFSKWCSILCFNTSNFDFIFMLLGLSIIFYASGNYFTSLLNGLSDYKLFNWLNGLNSMTSLVISVILIQAYHLNGAFIAVVLNQTVSCIISVFFIKKYLHFLEGFRKKAIEKEWLKNLGKFSLMAFTTVLLVPTTQIFIRKTLIIHVGITAAGNWEAINRISALYLSLLLNVMLVYYLPKLSAINQKDELRKEIRNGFKFFVPIVLITAVIIYLFRFIIINVFLSAKFIAIQDFFLPQLIGDFFKILAYLYAYLVIAKGLSVFFIITEVLTTLLLAVISVFFIKWYGTIGAVYSYLVTYIFYFLVQILFIGEFYLNEDINTRSWLWKDRRI